MQDETNSLITTGVELCISAMLITVLMVLFAYSQKYDRQQSENDALNSKIDEYREYSAYDETYISTQMVVAFLKEHESDNLQYALCYWDDPTTLLVHTFDINVVLTSMRDPSFRFASTEKYHSRLCYDANGRVEGIIFCAQP